MTQSDRPKTPIEPWAPASVAGIPSCYWSELEFSGNGAERLESADMLL